MNEQFLFRSTWEGDMDGMREDIMMMKNCTSPTFATEIGSVGNMNMNNNGNGYQGLFHANENLSYKN